MGDKAWRTPSAVGVKYYIWSWNKSNHMKWHGGIAVWIPCWDESKETDVGFLGLVSVL